MAEISTLVKDINRYLEEGGSAPSEAYDELGKAIAQSLRSSLEPRPPGRELRMSNLGTPCERKLWYGIREPEDAEVLPGSARLKFAFGHILEELVLWLAERAGHDVQGRQTESNINGVLGHRDAVIDGHLVDVKSASTYGFKKFEANGLAADDPFGYLTQLGGYLHASKTDELVRDKTTASFLVIDKTLGKMCLDTYKFPEYNYGRLVESKRSMLAQPNPPPRGFADVPDGKSGNRKLSVGCSYCEYKGKCWPKLRTFLYASGPVFLTSVSKLPLVPEVKLKEADVEIV